MSGEERTISYASPLGTITLAGEGESITGLWMENQKYFGSTLTPCAREGTLPVLEQAKKWLDAYFAGEKPGLTLPLAPRGSAFRQAVWQVLIEIPYGTVITYGEIARRLEEASGKRVSPRAVGGAVGHNPISLIIPCHRVVGAGGGLAGYAGGVEKKLWLLQWEAAPLLPR